MLLNRRRIYIAVSISATIILLFIIGMMCLRGVNYFADFVRGSCLNMVDSVFGPSDGFTVIAGERSKPYRRVYQALPKGFVHYGNVLLYRADDESTVKEVAKKAITFTHFYRSYLLENAIREYNPPVHSVVTKGTVLFIPQALPSLVPDTRNRVKPAAIDARGIYYSGNSLGNSNRIDDVIRYKKYGINAVVFDAKDVTGIINYHSNNPDVIKLDTHRERSVDNIGKVISTLKANGIYTIARISVFRDHLLYAAKPECAIRSAGTGKPWNQDSKELWCDPTNRFVQDYNIGLAIELAEKGVDEIQFDYIRFPTGENLGDARFAWHFGKMSREETITAFLKRAYGEIAKRNTRVSIDIFGVVAWGKNVDIRAIGQKIEMLSPHCDVLSPMVYPSHFNDDFDGHANPGDRPYYFIYNGCKKVMELSAKNARIRPWLQAFPWRVSNYNERYILNQIKAAKDSGASGYLFWSPSNNYKVVIRALRMMRNETHEEVNDSDSEG